MKNAKKVETKENSKKQETSNLETIRHSLSHLMSMAILEIYPKAGLGVGPSIENGFYQDYDLPEPIAEDILPKLEKRMRELIAKGIKFTQKDENFKPALAFYKHDPYKTEMINELGAAGEKKLSFYDSDWFHNLCKGPHVGDTKEINPKAFKLTKIAGAYWRGDSKNKMLTRIYGVAFATKEELDKYLTLLEEAKKRDHRIIGKELDLYSFHEEAPGMPFFHPKGMIIWNELMKYWHEVHEKAGYQIVKTPIILNKKLWLQSGHWDHYKENMYFTKIDEQDYALKPMNCPGGILVYKTKMHSYKELPIKMGEIGLVHRHELSGVLSGLFRVRAFHQDDAHIFCTEEQIKHEVQAMIDLFDKIYSQFGLTFHVELSTKPEKAMGDLRLWEKAEISLADAMKDKGMKFKINPGEGAFYGPKIDFHLNDALGRTWQCGTIQLDFQMPQKFDLSYEGSDGLKHQPVMLHRVVYGSVERFIGILVEHYAGKFPIWLSPVQVSIITVADRHLEFAEKLREELFKANIRVELDSRQESIGKKIRDNQMQKIPILVVIGDKEIENKTLAIRTLNGEVAFGVKKEELIKKVLNMIQERSGEPPSFK